MKIRIALLVIVALVATEGLPLLSSAGLLTATARAQDSAGALERGYRTGYSDGYQGGYRDSIDRAPRDFRNKEDYQRADRAYTTAYGPLEDYRDGYQQGFEAGYAAAYERRGFDSTIPTGIRRRGTQTPAPSTAPANNTVTADDPGDVNTNDTGVSTSGSSSSSTTSVQTSTSGSPNTMRGTVLIQRDTFMRVELLTNLSTEASQTGDRFQARVIEPAEYEGAMVDGRVTRVKRPGRVKSTAELQLTFEQIRLPDSRWSNLNAQLIEVFDTPGTGAGDVDSEGGVKGKDSTKGDIVKIGTGTAIGAIIGAIAGGGKGAAIGAAIGGGLGTGGVLSQRGRDIYLSQGQQLRIRTNSDVRIP